MRAYFQAALFIDHAVGHLDQYAQVDQKETIRSFLPSAFANLCTLEAEMLSQLSGGQRAKVILGRVSQSGSCWRKDRLVGDKKVFDENLIDIC